MTFDDSLRRFREQQQRRTEETVTSAAEVASQELGNHADSTSHLSAADRDKLDRYLDPTSGGVTQYLENVGPLAGYTAWSDIKQLRGRLIASTPPADGEVLVYDAALDQWVPTPGGGGVSDHGALSGLGDDDHLQYLTEGRGDARYPLLSALSESIDDRVAALLAAGGGVAITYDDATNTLTISSPLATANRAANTFFAGPTSGGAAPATFRTATAPRRFGWGASGTPATGVVTTPIYTADVALTLTAVTIYADTAPSGAALDIDIERWNGGSWATVFSTRPTVAAGQNGGGSGAAFSITSIAAGQRLRVNVIAVNGAANLTIELSATVGVI